MLHNDYTATQEALSTLKKNEYNKQPIKRDNIEKIGENRIISWFMYFISSLEALFCMVLRFADFILSCNIIKKFNCVVLFYDEIKTLILDENGIYFDKLYIFQI